MCVKGERRSLPPQKQTVSHMGERLPCSRPVPLRLVKLRFPRLRPARHCFRSPFLSCPIAMRRGIIVPCPATPAALAVGRREGTSAICLRCYMPKRACLSGLTLQKVKAHPLWSIFVLKMLPQMFRMPSEARLKPRRPPPSPLRCRRNSLAASSSGGGVNLRAGAQVPDGRYFQRQNALETGMLPGVRGREACPCHNQRSLSLHSVLASPPSFHTRRNLSRSRGLVKV